MASPAPTTMILGSAIDLPPTIMTEPDLHSSTDPRPDPRGDGRKGAADTSASVDPMSDEVIDAVERLLGS
jgi:hypothetical protein